MTDMIFLLVAKLFWDSKDSCFQTLKMKGKQFVRRIGLVYHPTFLLSTEQPPALKGNSLWVTLGTGCMMLGCIVL